MAKIVEYQVSNMDGRGNVSFFEGKEWRKIRRLVAECEAGMHPQITYIIRAVYGGPYDDILEEDFLYEGAE